MVVAPIVQLMDNLYEARFRFLEKMRTSQPRDTQEVRLEHAQLLKLFDIKGTQAAPVTGVIFSGLAFSE